MKKYFLLLFLITVLSCPGCNKQEINDSAIPLGLGVDWQNGKYTLSAQMAIHTQKDKGSSSGEPQFLVVSGNGRTITEAARNISLSFPRYPLWSHSGLLLIGDSIARQDAALFTDFFDRNRFVRKNSPLVIARDATSQEVFQIPTPLDPHPADAIGGILKIQEQQLGIYVPVKLSEFLEKLATPGVEPVVPMIAIEEQGGKNILKLDGTAIFRDRKMVGILDETESRGYRWMKPGMIEGGVIIIPSPLDKQKRVALELTRSMAKISPEIKGRSIRMKINIKAEGNFYEQNCTGNILTLENIPKMEALTNQEIAREATACISRAQGLKSDIFGWGRMIDQKDPGYWEELKENWSELFPGVDYDINVKFEIRRSYLTDKSFVFRE